MNIFKKFIAASTVFTLMFWNTSAVFAVGTNGSFELGTPPGVFTTLVGGDSTSITDWTVGPVGIDYIGSYWTAHEGSRSLDLNAVESGSISQTLTTVPGATYTVTFYLSGNPEGVGFAEEHVWYSPSVKVVRVSATGTAPEDFQFDTIAKGNTLSNMMWESHTYTFVATGTSTTLTFASQIEGAFGPALDNVVITEEFPDAPVECDGMSFTNIVNGTNGNEKLTGTSGNDLILARGGNDSIEGKGGDDCIVAGAGNDKIDAQGGDDVVLGGSGNDKITGEGGNDELFGEAGNDNMEGGNGNDTLVGGSGNDSLKGENGDDDLTGDSGNDAAHGGAGSDTCSAEATLQC